MRRRNKVAVAGMVVALALLLSGFSCNHAKSAAVAVNRYTESLSSFQDAAAKQHDNGKIDEAVYRNMLTAEETASLGARHLDDAIMIANSGGDFSAYTDLAQNSFNDLVSLLPAVSDPQTRAALEALAAISAGLLKDAVILIHQVKPAVPTQVPAAMWMLWGGIGLVGVVGMAGMGAGAGDEQSGLLNALAILKAIADLEPIALQFVLKVARSLKELSVEEVVSMNEKTLDKIDEMIKSERAKLDANKQPPS